MNQNILNQLNEAASFFVFNFLELSVLFLLVSFLVEIINLFLNPKKVQTLLSSNKSGYFIASGLGFLSPFCSCSTIPLTLGLLKARAAFGPIMTFLFTSPLISPLIIVVFYAAFGYKITLVYTFIAMFTSLCISYTLEKLGFEKYIKEEIFEDDKVSNKSACNTNISFIQNRKENKFSRIFNKALFKKTWKQFSSFLPYLALGIGIGAFVHGFVPQDLLAKYAGSNNPFAVVFSAFIGVPLYLSAGTMVGLAPILITKGVSLGSILALTIAGIGASLPEMIMLKKIFKAPIMIFFILSVFFMAITCGYLVNWLFS